MSRHSNSLAFLVAGETRLATLSQRVNLKPLRPLLLLLLLMIFKDRNLKVLSQDLPPYISPPSVRLAAEIVQG